MENTTKPDMELTHVDPHGKANMVNVGAKKVLLRKAIASGVIRMSQSTIKAVTDNELKKGDVLSVAQIAGVQAAKQTPLLIPLCHSLLLDKVQLDIRIIKEGIEVKCLAQCHGKTGVEMEALTGASIALLTIYDMCKAVDKNMSIERITLLKKEKKEISDE